MSNIIQVWSIQIAKWRKAKASDIPFRDITAKSASVENRAFAPDYEVVMAYKREEVSNGLYADLYEQRMLESIANQPEIWEALKTALINNPKVAFACYCGAGKFCHRHIFIDMLERYLAQFDIVIENMGELT